MDSIPAHMDNDEGEVCRVCRTEAEPDNPLYHPCKCSGSIRYVHSDCLIQWLGHSNKKTCELCGYAFSFKKVYPADMPSSLPPHLLLVRAVKDASRVLLMGLWFVMVAVTWLAILPFWTQTIWKGMFTGGSSLAYKIARDTPPESLLTPSPGFNRTALNESLQAIDHILNTPESERLVSFTTAHNLTGTGGNGTDTATWGDVFWFAKTLWRMPRVRRMLVGKTWQSFRENILSTLPKSIFHGQILAICVVLSFLTVFLLREWVNQNGPVDNPRADAPEMGGPARLEEFNPDVMRARWRRRQRPDELFPIVRGAGANRRANRVLARMQARMQEDPPQIEEALAEVRRADLGGGRGEDEDGDWTDEEGDGPLETLVMGPTEVEEPQELRERELTPFARQQRPAAVDDDPAAIREARNRYFAVADHNRDFAGIAPSENGEAGELQHPRPEPPFRFDFDIADVDRQPEAGSSTPQYSPIVNPQASTHQAEAAPPGEDRAARLIALRRPPITDDATGRIIWPGDPAYPAPEEPVPQPHAMPPVGEGQAEEEDDNAEEGDAVQGPEERDDDEFDDELDGEGFILEGDLEGIMEVAGLRGPPMVLLQNAFIVIVVLTAAITLFVHVPYVIGKMDLLGNVSIFGFPIQGLVVLAGWITKATDLALRFVKRTFATSVYQPLLRQLGFSLDDDAQVRSGWFMRVSLMMQWAVKSLLSLFGPVKVEDTGASEVPFIVPGPVGGVLETGFAYLGRAYTAVSEYFGRVGKQETGFARGVAIGVGYFDGIAILLIIAALGERGLGAFGKMVSDAVTTHGVVAKLGFFMLIELAIFPMLMGYVVDLCSLSLFPAGAMAKRMELQVVHPLLSMFVHWLVGTLFMFAFARFLSVCRSICRRGAMYMIRDPQDPSFSPVRDILDKSTLVQLHKLFVSAMMYLAVLVGPVGGLLYLIRAQPFFKDVLPLRLYYKESLTSSPIDLIVLLFLLPVHLKSLRSKVVFKAALKVWWNSLASWLHLTSYFEGVRYRKQEQTGPIEQKLLDIHRACAITWRTITRSKKPLPNYTGMEMRVPYSDSVILVKPRRAVFIEVDKQGIPLHDEGKITAVYQDRVGVKAQRLSKDDYCQVYLPPLYPIRFWIFGVTLWTGISCGLAFACFFPIIAGRLVLKMATTYQLHDGYAFIIGMYILRLQRLNAGHIGKYVATYVRHRTKAARYSPPRSFKRSLIKTTAKAARYMRYGYSAFVVLGCMPMLVALNLEVFVLMPGRYGWSDMTPVFYASEAWSYGILTTAMLYLYKPSRKYIVRWLAGPDLVGTPDNWIKTATAPRNVSRELMLPAVKYSAMTVGGPGLVALGLVLGLGLEERSASLLFRFIYPTTALLLFSRSLMALLSTYLQRWSTYALETVYLVEKRVVNIEDGEKPGEVVQVMEGEPEQLGF